MKHSYFPQRKKLEKSLAKAQVDFSHQLNCIIVACLISFVYFLHSLRIPTKIIERKFYFWLPQHTKVGLLIYLFFRKN